VIGISRKDRSAILMAGRMADLALWWDTQTGAFVSSTWYASELLKWAADFNAGRPADAWLGREWRALGEGGAVLGWMPQTPGPAYYGSLYDSAFGNELLVSLAEKALEGAQLGTRDATDLPALSFSCNDAVGHGKGPHSAEIRDITLRTDLALERLLAAIDRRVGLARTVVVVTADHGVAPVPEQMKEWKMPAGRLPRAELEGRVPSDPWSRRVLLSFHRERSGDVDVLLEPYWMSASSGTTHGTAHSYDTHIPLMVMGPGIRPGRYDRTVVLNDLAPTLATLLGIETPSGASGRALAEILAPGGAR
jgi:hypothetical protein